MEQRYSSTLSLTSALDGVGGQHHASVSLLQGKTWYTLYKRLGGLQGPGCTGVENLAPLGIRSPDRPACSESLNGLHCSGPHDCVFIPIRSTVQNLPLSVVSATVNKDNSSALIWNITQRREVFPFPRFGTTYRSHLQGSRSPHLSAPYAREKKSKLHLKTGPIGCTETSVR